MTLSYEHERDIVENQKKKKPSYDEKNKLIKENIKTFIITKEKEVSKEDGRIRDSP